MWKLCMNLDYNHLYIPLTFKYTRQISATSQHFFWQNNLFSIKSTVVWVRISEKKYQFFRLEISLPQASKQKKKNILPLEKYFKTLKDMIIGTAGT